MILLTPLRIGIYIDKTPSCVPALHGFTPVEEIKARGFGGIGEINTNVRDDLGGIGAVTNIEDLRHIGDIDYEIDHMNSVLETSIAAEQAMQLSDLSDLSNLKDITKGWLGLLMSMLVSFATVFSFLPLFFFFFFLQDLRYSII